MADLQKILIVDDKPENIFALKKVLDGLGCEFVCARSGPEALKTVLNNVFSLAIIDVKMPEMDGFELASYLISEEEGKNFPIIFLSGHCQDESNIFKGYETGAIDFLTKPIDPVIIRSKVKVFLKLDAQKREIILAHQELQGSMEKLNLLNSQLEKEIVERRLIEKKLEEARKEAVSANDAKSRFLAVVSHEVRNPLNAIIGYSQVLVNAEELPEEYRNDSKVILARGNDLLKIIDGLLDHSKIEAGKVDIAEIDFSISSLMTEVMDTFSLKAKQRDNLLTFKVDPSIPTWLKGDPNKLKQILFNLLGNAIKFTENGRVEVRASLFSHSDKEKLGLKFSISDTGIGISSETIGLLFNPFVQVGVETQKKFGGSGLGLSISKKLIELMGGEVTVESVLGAGSTFNFSVFVRHGKEKKFLPEISLKIEDPSKSVPEFSKNADMLIPVLIVEDDAQNRLLTKLVLKKKGCRVFEAENGMEALELFQKNRFSLIMMDLQLPGIDGFEAAAKMKEQEKESGRSTPIVALTACVTPEIREKCLSVGMHDYLSKPLDFEKLDSIVNELRKNVFPEKFGS
ncbi:MAG: response regulator [Candidatus Riflebacteria bacterium]|nr:response regulator [Candidatus Riflebacteria bacterium]